MTWTVPIVGATLLWSECRALKQSMTHKQREVAFHNERFRNESSDERAALDPWYDAVESGALRQLELILRYGREKSVLELGCADGRFSLLEHPIASRAAQFRGIDISECAIARASASALEAGLRHSSFATMDAEKLTFPDREFDLVFGRGIIHHLCLERAFAEVRRVLRPEGIAVFYEPMGHNPVLNQFRQRTPNLRTPGEHPLLVRDFTLARRYFGVVDVRYYGLTTLGPAALPNGRLRQRALWACEQLDSMLLRVPLLKRNAWFALLVLAGEAHDMERASSRKPDAHARASKGRSAR